MRMRGSRLWRQVLNNLALAIVTMVVFVPLWYFLNNAFKVKKFIPISPMVIGRGMFTLANIRDAFVALNYPRAFINSAIILVLSCVLIVALSSAAGFAIARVRSRLLNGFYMVFVLAITLPFGLAMIPLMSLLKSLHLLNSYFGTSLVYVAMSTPFAVFLYTGFMRIVPGELEEAAIVDGCGLFRTFLHIFLPLLKATTGTVIILRGVGIWNDLLVPLLTISRARMIPLTLQLYGYLTFTKVTYWELIFAGTLLVSLPVMAAFLFLQKYIVSGITAGALKQ